MSSRDGPLVVLAIITSSRFCRSRMRRSCCALTRPPGRCPLSGKRAPELACGAAEKNFYEFVSALFADFLFEKDRFGISDKQFQIVLDNFDLSKKFSLSIENLNF